MGNAQETLRSGWEKWAKKDVRQKEENEMLEKKKRLGFQSANSGNV
jgi:hypothetical protein